VGIEYLGLAGHQNLGDDAMLEAIRRLMPWAEIGTDLANPRVVMLGGGTLLNAGNYYLNKVRRVDGPNQERIVFGTGVRGPEYWGLTERLEDWEPFFRSALSLGVRGPDSLATMRAWGYDGPVDVLGDPALSLERPDDVEDVAGRVVICPVYTAGECWGGDDGAVFDELARTISRLKTEGRDVVMMTAHPADDRWAIEIMRRSGYADLPYLAGYEDLDETLRLLASADLVIGERLHAVVLAAAMGTAFVAVEYRPKVHDFVSSIGAEDWCIRTDGMGQLSALISERSEASVDTAERVGGARRALRSRAADLARELRVRGHH
jgi:polysaccharide pyruvyl transferase WcaK-like protein